MIFPYWVQCLQRLWHRIQPRYPFGLYLEYYHHLPGCLKWKIQRHNDMCEFWQKSKTSWMVEKVEAALKVNRELLCKAVQLAYEDS